MWDPLPTQSWEHCATLWVLWKCHWISSLHGVCWSGLLPAYKTLQSILFGINPKVKQTNLKWIKTETMGCQHTRSAPIHPWSWYNPLWPQARERFDYFPWRWRWVSLSQIVWFWTLPLNWTSFRKVSDEVLMWNLGLLSTWIETGIE